MCFMLNVLKTSWVQNQGQHSLNIITLTNSSHFQKKDFKKYLVYSLYNPIGKLAFLSYTLWGLRYCMRFISNLLYTNDKLSY